MTVDMSKHVNSLIVDILTKRCGDVPVLTRTIIAHNKAPMIIA